MPAAAYQVLCSVTMRHPYFADGRLGELAARPTPATAERLRRLGVVYKPQADGFVLLYAPPGAAAGPLLPPPGLFPLQFGLALRDPYFANYSDLPLSAAPAALPGQVYCLQPPLAEPAAPRLQQAAAVGAADQLALRPCAFSLPLAAAPQARPVRLRLYRRVAPLTAADADGFTTLSPTADGQAAPGVPATVPANATSLPLDVRAWGSGRYRLEVGTGKTRQTVDFFCDDSLSFARPWGVLELGAQGAPSAGMAYVLQFAARATYWRYHFLARHRPLPPGLRIAGGDGGSFAVPAAAAAGVLPVNMAAEGPVAPDKGTVLQSEKKLFLAERQSMLPYQLLSIHLAPDGQNRSQVVQSALPNASPRDLRQEDGRVISDIIVYL
jgi:hypothetical protein